jgi:predicted dienelactone hydrolase
VVAAVICKDTDGFNRKEFHAEFNDSVLSFYQEHLVQ